MTTATHSVECEYFAQSQTATQVLAQFKTNVRDSFIDFADLHDIDTDDANAFLDSLGLEGVESDFPITASFTYIIELNVKARNESEAQDKANNELFTIAPSSIRIDDEDGVEGGYAQLDTYEIV
jgi:type III secretion system FlhB-like substrate exporter